MVKKSMPVIMIGLLALTRCSKKETEPEYVGTSTFPLSTDSRWEYEKIVEVTTFGDSVAVDSEFFQVFRHVVGPDTVIDDNQTIAVDDSILRADSVDQDPEVIRHLYCINEDRFLEFGQVGIIPGGQEYADYFDPPHLIIDLPITPYKTWTESADEFTFVQDEVVGIQYVSAAGTEIKCDVIQSQLMNQLGHVYSQTYYWYSNSGLIQKKRETIEFPENCSAVRVDSLRRLEVMELIDMDLQGE